MREEYLAQQGWINAKHCLHHRGKIVLVDEVLECYESGVLTQTIIHADNPFLQTNGEERIFPMFQGIELIAQSLGCYQRILNLRDMRDEKTKIGFLLSARNFEIFHPYAKIGQRILTLVEITTQDEHGFGVCEGKIYFDCICSDYLACRSSVSVLSPKEGVLEFLGRKNG